MPWLVNQDTTVRTRNPTRRGLLLIGRHLDAGQPCGVIYSDMSFLITGSRGAALAAINSDVITNLLKAGQLFGVDMDHVAGHSGGYEWNVSSGDRNNIPTLMSSYPFESY